MAGKTTILKAFANSRGLKMYQFDPLEGATPEFVAAGLPLDGQGAEVIDRGERVYDGSTDVGLATIWGPFWNTNSWPTLLAKAAAVILVLDPQVSRDAADRDCVAALGALAKPPHEGCVIWTKQDLVAEGAQTVPTSMLHGTMAEQWRAFTTRFDKPSSLVEPIEWLLRQIPTAASPV